MEKEEVIVSMKELNEELALILLLGFVGLKSTPYVSKFKEKFNIDKERYKTLKKMAINELSARYSFLDIENTMKGE